MSRVGISLHNSFKRKEESSGPRPRCLASFHDLFQLVSGHSDSQFSGLSGQSEKGRAVSPSGGSVLLFRTDDISH